MRRPAANDPDPEARWNWWISNHGTHIAISLFCVAALMLAAAVWRGRQPDTTSATRSTVASEVITLPSLQATTVPPASPSTIAPPSTTTTVETTPPTTAPAPTTTVPEVVPAVDPERSSLLDVPHLQLVPPPTGWLQVSRHATVAVDEQPAATSFIWAGPGGRLAVLQVAKDTVPLPGRIVRVADQDINVAGDGAVVSMSWAGPADSAVSLRTTGLTGPEAIALATTVSEVSNAEWARLVQRAKLVESPPRESILSEDW